MAQASFFAAYVQDRRQVHIERFTREDCGHLVRHVASDPSAEGLVAYAALKAGHEAEQIREQVEYFRSIGQDFEWKVYELDKPISLEALLAAEAFVPGEQEAFMAYEIEGATLDPPFIDRAWKVERVASESGIRDVLSVQEEVWGCRFEWLYTQLTQRLSQRPDELSVYCAYAAGKAVGSGWVEFPEGSQFPEIHGGAVLEDWRGRGLYSELFAVRLREVKRRGFAFLCVDASRMSRPILENIGFQQVCTTVPMRKSVA